MQLSKPTCCFSEPRNTLDKEDAIVIKREVLIEAMLTDTQEIREGFGTLDFANSGSAVIAERSLFQAVARTNHLRSTHLISLSNHPRRRDNGLETGSAIVAAGLLFWAETVGRNAQRYGHLLPIDFPLAHILWYLTAHNIIAPHVVNGVATGRRYL